MAKQVNILIGGEAGQGIQTIGELLSRVCHQAGLFVFSVNDFESRIRGGHSFNLMRISNEPVTAPARQVDILACMDLRTLEMHRDALADHSVVLVEKALDTSSKDDEQTVLGDIVEIRFTDLAIEAGGKITANTVLAGAVLNLIGAGFYALAEELARQFLAKGQSVLDLNLAAAQKGFDAVSKVIFGLTLPFDVDASPGENVIMNGVRAAALGALAADCRFYPFYPMSPATGIVSEVAAVSDRLPVVVEQAEDEIAAVNMAIGASFAGVRSLVATSGGGFCLMTEGLGLAGITEIPLVIIDAQRPGPATGMPTRTAQADLLFAIHASQDDFLRFVFAPGTAAETFQTVKKAFSLADYFQVPVIILMDQFLADTIMTEATGFDFDAVSSRKKDMKQDESEPGSYLRYRVTGSGISLLQELENPDHIVRVTGNEHDEGGFTSESAAVRIKMMDKRAAKLKGMLSRMERPVMFSPESSILLVGWGSLKGSIMEACCQLRSRGFDVGSLVFKDIWPMDETVIKPLIKGKTVIMVEGNSTAQMGELICRVTGIRYHAAVLQYDGRPVYPEFIVYKVSALLEQKQDWKTK